MELFSDMRLSWVGANPDGRRADEVKKARSFQEVGCADNRVAKTHVHAKRGAVQATRELSLRSVALALVGNTLSFDGVLPLRSVGNGILWTSPP